jgi:hypothetical protein
MQLIKAFDPFQANLYDLQLQDETLQTLQNFQANNEWLSHLSKQDQAYYKILLDRVFQGKNKLVWVCLDDFKYSSIPTGKVQERSNVQSP